MHLDPVTKPPAPREATTKSGARNLPAAQCDGGTGPRPSRWRKRPSYQPRNGKWLTGIGRSVQEIRIAYSKEAYRVIYVTKLADCIYVLHAFQKKSKTGIETPKEEIDLAKKRYKELVQSLRKS